MLLQIDFLYFQALKLKNDFIHYLQKDINNTCSLPMFFYLFITDSIFQKSTNTSALVILLNK